MIKVSLEARWGDYPWRCLCFGFVQITRTLRRRRIRRQL